MQNRARELGKERKQGGKEGKQSIIREDGKEERSRAGRRKSDLKTNGALEPRKEEKERKKKDVCLFVCLLNLALAGCKR